MKKINVLVLGVGGNVSQGIIKALKLTKLDLYIVGACVTEDNVGYLWSDKHYIAPYASDERFIDWVIGVCRKEKIDIIFSGVEENILILKKNLEYIQSKTDAEFISADYEHLMIGQDKYATCEWLRGNKCNYPQYALGSDRRAVEEMADLYGLPLLVKPRTGKSAQGVMLIRNKEELACTELTEQMVVQEYIGTENSEYTVGCYDNHYIIMKRVLKNGTTWRAEVVEDQAVLAESQKIYQAFGQTGPLNIQLRKNDNGEPVCFELNVRFSGTTAMRANFGFEDVKAMLMDYIFHEDNSSCFNIRAGKAWRYDEEIYKYE